MPPEASKSVSAEAHYQGARRPAQPDMGPKTNPRPKKTAGGTAPAGPSFDDRPARGRASAGCAKRRGAAQNVARYSSGRKNSESVSAPVTAVWQPAQNSTFFEPMPLVAPMTLPSGITRV